MLVLTRKIGQKITVGDDITIVVQKISGTRVAIGVEAPDNVRVLRGELEPFPEAESTYGSVKRSAAKPLGVVSSEEPPSRKRKPGFRPLIHHRKLARVPA